MSIAYTGLRSGSARARASKTLVANGDTGAFLLEAKAFEHWFFGFKSSGTVTGGSVTIYGGVSEQTVGVLARANTLGAGYLPDVFVSDGHWYPLVAKAMQSEAAASVNNPITAFDGTQQMIYDGPLYGVRLVANAFVGGGSILVDVLVVE